MHQLPETGFLRLPQIIGDPGDPKADPPKPPTPALIPVKKSTWWQGIREGRYPKGVKISKRCTAWRCEQIRKLIEGMTSQHDTEWAISAKGNWWRQVNGTLLVVSEFKNGRIWARVGDDLLDGEYDSLREAKAAADSEGRKS